MRGVELQLQILDLLGHAQDDVDAGEVDAEVGDQAQHVLQALDIAVRCIRGRSAGVAGILAEIEEILQIEGVRAVEVSV